MRTVSGLVPIAAEVRMQSWAREVAPAEGPLALARVVIVEDVRRSSPPAGVWPAGHLDPDAGD